jgi:hypothetical protein
MTLGELMTGSRDVLRIAVQGPQLVKDKDNLTNACLGHIRSPIVLLVPDKLLQGGLTPVDQDGCGNLGNLVLDFSHAALHHLEGELI